MVKDSNAGHRAVKTESPFAEDEAAIQQIYGHIADVMVVTIATDKTGIVRYGINHLGQGAVQVGPP